MRALFCLVKGVKWGKKNSKGGSYNAAFLGASAWSIIRPPPSFFCATLSHQGHQNWCLLLLCEAWWTRLFARMGQIKFYHDGICSRHHLGANSYRPCRPDAVGRRLRDAACGCLALAFFCLLCLGPLFRVLYLYRALFRPPFLRGTIAEIPKLHPGFVWLGLSGGSRARRS